MDKTAIRRKMLLVRKNMSKDDVLYKSRAIYKKVISLDEIKSANSIFIYVSFENEPDTFDLINYFLTHKKLVYAPVINKDTGIDARSIDDIKRLKTSSFGILEPLYGSSIDKQSIDAAIIPGVAFDYSKNRVGFGKAYYDRFLEGTSFYKAALAYDHQIIDKIPISNKDIPMDVIITESRIIL